MIEKKHNYFYKTTNSINGKFYYGIHSTDNFNDGYLGTGKLIKRAIKLHGKENFVKEIIADYPTRKESSDHEKLVVTMDLVLDDDCYNLKTGGLNEATFSHTEATKRRIGETSKGHSRNKGIRHSDETKNRMRIAQLKRITDEFREMVRQQTTGRKHSDESKIKMKAAAKLRSSNPDFIQKLREANTGERNPNFGKKTSDKTKQLISDANSGENHPNARKCIIFGITYISRLDASKVLGIPKTTLHRRIDSTKPKWSDYKNYSQELIC